MSFHNHDEENMKAFKMNFSRFSATIQTCVTPIPNINQMNDWYVIYKEHHAGSPVQEFAKFHCSFSDEFNFTKSN